VPAIKLDKENIGGHLTPLHRLIAVTSSVTHTHTHTVRGEERERQIKQSDPITPMFR